MKIWIVSFSHYLNYSHCRFISFHSDFHMYIFTTHSQLHFYSYITFVCTYCLYIDWLKYKITISHKVNESLTNWLELGRWVRQGCCLSPTVFKPYIQQMLRNVLEGNKRLSKRRRMKNYKICWWYDNST